MAYQRIKDRIYYIGTRDWDRTIFDELIPLPEGTSYNSYFIQGSEKNAIIDSVDPEKKDIYLSNLESLNIKKVDYIIANHAEQDHSGLIPMLLKKYPNAKVVTNQKCKSFLMDLLLLSDDSFIVVGEGESISLGDKTLTFYMAPWVHWPETMVTFLEEDKILFSCDFFGSHVATSDLFVENECYVYFNAKRYYAEIMMPFRTSIRKNIAKVESLNPEIIAPSHGPLYSNPGFIIDAYKDWASDNVKKEVVLPYVSMHGSTKLMVEYLTKRLIEKGIKVLPFNITHADMGEITMSLVDASTVVIASPTVLTGPHPAAVSMAYLVNAVRPKTKFMGIIGSFGWAGKMVDILKELLSNVKAEILEPVVAKGQPNDEIYDQLEKLADIIVEKNSQL